MRHAVARLFSGPAMTVRLALILSLALAAVFVLQEVTTDGPLYPDVWGFWTFGRYALTHSPATIYDNAALHAFQAGLGMPAENGFYPYPYPPWFLLAVAPLGGLPYPTAALVWRGVTFTALVVALGAWRWQWDRALLLAVAPACALSFVVGQNGFLTAALMLGGLRLLPVRPVLAGVLLAATAYKPQLALLVPAFLLFGAHWRALAGAVLGTALLTAAATLMFGWAVWPAWADAMQAQALALTAGRGPKLDQMPTVTAAVQLLGGSAGMARAVQGMAAAGAMVALWRARRRAEVIILPLATFVATPYAFGYDLPVLTGAALVALEGHRSPVLLLIVLAPCMLVLPFGAVMVSLLFGVALWHRAMRSGLA